VGGGEGGSTEGEKFFPHMTKGKQNPYKRKGKREIMKERRWLVLRPARGKGCFPGERGRLCPRPFPGKSRLRRGKADPETFAALVGGKEKGSSFL